MQGVNISDDSTQGNPLECNLTRKITRRITITFAGQQRPKIAGIMTYDANIDRGDNQVEGRAGGV